VGVIGDIGFIREYRVDRVSGTDYGSTGVVYQVSFRGRSRKYPSGTPERGAGS
jgi:hypothetical protein